MLKKCKKCENKVCFVKYVLKVQLKYFATPLH